MPPRGTRRELADSVRLLVSEELWLFVGLAGGAVGYFIWIAGTGAAVEQFARALPDTLPIARESVELGAFVVLWVLVPSVVAVRYVVDRVTNLRGNVEQRYRFDRPLVLLGPPGVLVLGVLAFTVVRGTVGPVALVALGAANVVLLVRTVAYGYRVYSLSLPRALQGLLFVAAVAMSLGIVSRTASMAGQEALVGAIVGRYGLDGTVAVGAAPVPLLALVAATAPGLAAVSYVWVQVFAGLIVRIRRPDVPRSAVRAGQRYPRAVRPGTGSRPAMGTALRASDDADDSGVESAGEPRTDETDGPGSAGGAAGTDGGPGAATTDSVGDAADDRGHRFGQTRVYTPPEDGDSDTVKSKICPICCETYAADAGYTNCPNCNAVIETE